MSGVQAYKVFHPSEKSEDARSPVIFLHAMLCSKEIWTDIPQRVANETKRTVYTYDARCHGVNKGQDSFSFEALVDDLNSFMTEQKIEKAVLVGHSMGGKTVIDVAIKSPEKVEQLFVVDMYISKIEDSLIERSIKFMDAWKDAVQKLPEGTPTENITKLSVQALYNQLSDSEQMPTEKEAYLMSTFVYSKTDGKHDVSYNAAALKAGLEKYQKSDVKTPAGVYEGPAYFLYGTESPYTVGEKDEEATRKSLLPKSEMIPFKGAPHHIFVHSANEFVKVLVEKINMTSS